MERHVSAQGRPFERIGGAVRRLSPPAAAAGGVVLTLAAGVLDYLTGPQLAPLTFYLVPVAIVGWAGARWHGILCAALAGASWATAEAANGRAYDSVWVFAWASLTRFAVFLAIALLVSRARDRPPPQTAETAGHPCPHCGSTDTVLMRMGLVCQGCKRLS